MKNDGLQKKVPVFCVCVCVCVCVCEREREREREREKEREREVVGHHKERKKMQTFENKTLNPLNAELNPICQSAICWHYYELTLFSTLAG